MKFTEETAAIYRKISADNMKMGEIKKLAKEIKTNHALALELWNTGEYQPRLLAVLIMDKKKLTLEILEGLAGDLSSQSYEEGNYIADWLMANQLMKNKDAIALMESWENHPLPLLRRLFWYYQARLRWTGKTPPANSPALMASLEETLEKEEPRVQWTMNFCAAQIGIREPEYRARCISLGEKLGLYENEKAPRGCTPNYLPEFIRIEVEKLDKKRT